MKSILLYLVPPLIGAVIGFVTNAIAIKMLFRPLKEIRLFCGRGHSGGIRLLFTPGVLPRQRHKLADSIGAMVERELLTPEILRERLKSDSVRRSAAQSVSGFTGKLLAFPLGDLLAKLPGRASAGSAAPAGEPPLPAEILRDFSCSPLINEFLDTLFASLLETALKNANGDIAGKPLFSLSIREILGEKRTAALREKQDAIIRETLNRKMTALPLKIKPLLLDFYPKASSRLIKALKKPEIHKEMEIQGRIFMENAMQKLSVFQRFFISAGQYDRTLSERMPEIIDDLITQFENLFAENATRERITDFLSDTVLSLAAESDSYDRLVQLVSDVLFSFEDRPVGELFEKFGIQNIPALIAKLRRFFGNPAGEEAIALTGGGNVTSGTDGAIAESGFAGAVFSVLRRFLEEHAEMTMAEILPVGEEKKRRIDTAIRERLLSLADKLSESALKTIDVRAMVTRRIDDLDMLRVERIILDVVADQLKWINLFGAILGALIGGAQVLVSVLFK
jgi:uncharacterized membrane protein YheB (UPF0754 family)